MYLGQWQINALITNEWRRFSQWESPDEMNGRVLDVCAVAAGDNWPFGFCNSSLTLTGLLVIVAL